jgi:hypothetical protein
MKTRTTALFLMTACLAASTGAAANYSTEATISLQKEEGTLNVDVRVSRMEEKGGKLVEELVAAPRIKTSPGVPGTLHQGCQPADPSYAHEDNVTVDVSWPYPNETGLALCAVTVKHGDEVVSKSKWQLKVEGPGRTPLVVAARDVDPKSVRVVDEKTLICILLEFAGKTKEEVKKLAIENYGNKVQVRDSQGRLTEGGAAFGTYHELGMCLQCKSEDEAKHVASILRGEDTK